MQFFKLAAAATVIVDSFAAALLLQPVEANTMHKANNAIATVLFIFDPPFLKPIKPN